MNDEGASQDAPFFVVVYNGGFMLYRWRFKWVRCDDRCLEHAKVTCRHLLLASDHFFLASDFVVV